MLIFKLLIEITLLLIVGKGYNTVMSTHTSYIYICIYIYMPKYSNTYTNAHTLLLFLLTLLFPVSKMRSNNIQTFGKIRLP